MPYKFAMIKRVYLIRTELMKRMLRTVIFLLPLLCVACATRPPVSGVSAKDQDPYETYNKNMWSFNVAMDKHFLKPVAKVYTGIVAPPIRTGVANVFSNLGTIPTIFNDTLQGNISFAIANTWRFLINSTVGVAGVFDVASHMGLKENKTDFGVTLAHWGYTNSNYLVLPFFGPSTVRDALALPVNTVTSVYPYIDPVSLRNQVYAAKTLSDRSRLLEEQRSVSRSFGVGSPDDYNIVKDNYLYERDKAIEKASS